MIRVVGVSGEELISTQLRALADPKVKALKQQLESICGASRFRQRLLHGGRILEDSANLTPQGAEIVELQHVVLPFSPTSDQHVEELLGAIRCKNLRMVEEILQRPQDPNQNEPSIEGTEADADALGYEEHAFEKLTFLGAACRAGDSDIVRILIEARANVDRCFGNEDAPQTPLGIACTHGYPEIVRVLLEAGAYTSLRIDGQSLLVVAAEYGHCKIVRLLVQAGLLPKELLERMALVRHCPELEQLLPALV